MSENSAPDSRRDLSDAERARQIEEALGVTFTPQQLEALLKIVLVQRSGGVDVDGAVSVGGHMVGRDLNVFQNVPFSPEEVEELRRLIPLVKQLPDLQRGAYAISRAGQPDLSPIDVAALARRLSEARRSGDARLTPLKQAEREAPLYVPLKLKFSRHRQVSAQSPFELERDFDDILEAVQAPEAGPGTDPYPALLLLGAPGGGKSTALRHLALDRFNWLVAHPDDRLPLFVSLGEYQDAALSGLRRFLDEPDLPLTPLNFLRAHWYAWFGGDDFVRALDEGRLWLILDGLNEIPDRYARVPDWKAFFDRDAGRFGPPNRAIVACRRADYGNWLGLPYLDLETLDLERIRDFAGRRLERLGRAAVDDVMRRLEDDDKLLEVVSNPFWLRMLTDYVEDHSGHLPEGRTPLIDWFVDAWLSYGHGRADLPALSPEDVEALAIALEPFAYWLLNRSDNAPVAWEDAENCCGAWGSRSKGEALRRAEAASLLVRETAGVKFYHQLVLEYFAGREVARRFSRDESQAERWRIPWRNWSFVHSEWQRLSGPPTTRWEEAIVFAAARPKVNLDAFTRAVLAEHPPLAARCLMESGKEAPRELRQAVIDRLQALVERRDPMLDTIPEWSARLSLRIAAGHALGKLGDPRILSGTQWSRRMTGQGRATIESDGEKKEIAFIEPIWCPVQAGPFRMGSDTSDYADEQPEHTCEVVIADYAIGMFPVTNAEYNCFVQAEGYDTEIHWTPQGWAWRHQDISTAQPPGWWFWRRDWAKQNLDRIRQWPERGIGRPVDVEFYEAEARRTDEELVTNWRRRELSLGRYRNPWHTDRDLNGRNQPVVGVCWHEAMAYCAWLTEALRAAGRIKENQIVTLPNEPEWEKAALQIQNPKVQTSNYPWGDEFRPERANTLEGRVLTTTPVGVYDSASGCGAFDMSGNVWEWTRSRWGDDPQTPKFGYPYSEDLEERERPDADDFRIVRGGSWNSEASLARRSYRDRDTPDLRDNFAGFRCVLRSL